MTSRSLGWTKHIRFPEKVRAELDENGYDRFDPVTFSDDLGDEFLRNGVPVVIDRIQRNSGSWRHSITEYLRGGRLRTLLALQMGIQWP